MKGLLPRKYKDHRRYSYSRTFGSTAETVPDFILDNGRKNQNVPDDYWGNPALPNGCTGFAVTGIAETDVKQPVNPAFTYKKTLFIENAPDNSPVVMEDAFRSAVVYGVEVKGEDPLAHRRAPYFEVHPDQTHDWWDAVLSAVWTNQRPVSIGTAWGPILENVDADGVQRSVPGSWVGGHAHNIIGKKTINGVEYLIDDTWNGEAWGDHGLCYWARNPFNQLMSIPGSDALTNRAADPSSVLTVRLNIIELLISLSYRLLNQLRSWTGSIGFSRG